VYLSEMAPAKLRGALNIMFQLATSIGAPAISILSGSCLTALVLNCYACCTQPACLLSR